MKLLSAFLALSVVCNVLARPAPQDSSFQRQNGEDAINQNQQFASLTADSACNTGDNACVNQEFAQCVDGKFILTPCGSGLICAALPLVNSQGTTVTCTTQSDLETRIAATGASDSDGSGDSSGSTSDSSSSSASSSGSSTTRESSSSSSRSSTAAASSQTSSSSSNSNNNGNDGNNSTSNDNNNNNNGDLQTSLCLDSSLVQTGFEKDGQQDPAENQVASATSSNNFINFCATVDLPLTNGQQVKGGSCNAAPMGVIASTNNMPSAKFQSPKNLDKIKANTAFTVKLAVNNLATGNFVNAAANYFSAPQTIDNSGNIVGHSHVVIEKVNDLTDTSVTDPSQFAFFKGLNEKAQDGVLSAEVTDGLPAGTYRIATINSAANHQPVLVAVAQHGSLDDMVYFTVTDDGN
ncbi:hypothetical protein ACEPAH_379 [Sanghuangporus vaninii]